ncbi:hypothetical protein HPHPH41_1372 [Helicobacter pylori Hp H-41]|nr:hypothetical protein HPHPH41_1372 [Helicobacter pylori Hp H-41]
MKFNKAYGGNKVKSNLTLQFKTKALSANQATSQNPLFKKRFSVFSQR